MRRALLIALFLVCPAPTALAAEAKKPNFVFIYTDDQRWDAMSVVQKEQGDKGRFPWFETPNLDRIAKEGVRFDRCMVPNSICGPSRAFIGSRLVSLSYDLISCGISPVKPVR